LQTNKATTLVPVFSPLIKCLATKPSYTTKRSIELKLTHKFSDLHSFNWKNAGEKFIGESGLYAGVYGTYQGFSPKGILASYVKQHLLTAKITSSLKSVCSWLDHTSFQIYTALQHA